MRKKYKPSTAPAKFDFLYVFLAMIVSGIAAIVAMAVYTDGYWMAGWNEALRVGFAFFLFSAVLFSLMLLLSIVTKRFKENVLTGRRKIGPVVGILAGLCAAVTLCSALFQFIYELNFVKGSEAYVFLMDISTSMDSTDKNATRYDAIEELIEEQGEDFPYMIYTFNEEIQILREMATEEEEPGFQQPASNEGATALFNVLEYAYESYEDGDWGKVTRPQVVMITDATDDYSTITVEDVLPLYQEANIPVSVVHMFDPDSGSFYAAEDWSGTVDGVTAFADGTGGTYVEVDDLDDLYGAVSSSLTRTPRSLLGTRKDSGGISFLYMALRVLFLTLIACLIGFATLMAYGRHETGKLTLISIPIKAFAVSLLFELALQSLPYYMVYDRNEGAIIFLLFLIGIPLTAKCDDEYAGVVPRKGYTVSREDDLFL